MGNVMVIPAKRQIGNTGRKQDAKPKLRVAAYCRVSTDSDEPVSYTHLDVYKRQDIINIQSYRCTMTYYNKNYVDVITVEDKSDPYVSEMLSIGGFTVKNNLGGLVPYIIVRTNQQEVDALLGIISETAPSSPKSGDFWYKIDHSAKSVTLMKYSGSAWANATEKQSLTYTWYAQDKDGKEITFTKTGKVIYLSAADIDSLLTLQCDVSN